MANRLGSLARLSRSVGAETTSDDVSRDSPLTNNEEAAAAQPAEQIAQDAGQDAGSKKVAETTAEGGARTHCRRRLGRRVVVEQSGGCPEFFRH